MSDNQKIIALANDHGACGLASVLINDLKQRGYEVLYFGVERQETVDYPDKAALVVNAVLNMDAPKGILLCGSGIGISVAANRYRGIVAALCHDECTARLSRQHNNSNILVMGGRTTGTEVALGILDVWLKTEFEGGRHINRLKKIDEHAEKAWAEFFGI